jgi:hypothetical protein
VIYLSNSHEPGTFKKLLMSGTSYFYVKSILDE